MATGKIILTLSPKEAYVLRCLLDVAPLPSVLAELREEHSMPWLTDSDIHRVTYSVWHALPEIDPRSSRDD